MTHFSLQPFRPIVPSLSLKIEGTMARNDNKLYLNYSLTGELEAVKISNSSDSPTRQNDLWQETCFEFFLGLQDSPMYWEFNLSPAGDWNIYRFESYRQGMQEERNFQYLPFTVKKEKDCLGLNLELNLDSIVPIEQKLDAAITTVIESKDGKISYWALTHCGSEADFHLRESFTIEL